jgi:hypothetical protein
MSSNKIKTLSKQKSHPSRAEDMEEEARLDALIPARPALPAQIKTAYPKHASVQDLLPSRIDKISKAGPFSKPTDGFLNSRLDSVSNAGPSSGLTGRRLPSRLDPTSKDYLPSRLDPRRDDGLPSKLDSTRRDYLPSKLDDTSKQTGEPIKTAFKSKHDIKMASRQTMYDFLSPEEQKFQEDWAQEKINQMRPCPAGLWWDRIPGGYACTGGHHWMSDELLAKGEGVWYLRRSFVPPDWQNIDVDVDRARGLLHRRTIEMPQMPPMISQTNLREVGFIEGLKWFRGPYYHWEDEDRDRYKDHDRLEKDMRAMIKKRLSSRRKS